MSDGGKPLDGSTVLVVDDNPDAIEIVDTILTYFGALTLTAQSGKQALAQLAQARVTVIVSDISMPGFSGHEFIRALRALPPEAGGTTPAIALTAFNQAGQREAAMSAGFDAYCVKPFDPDALVEQVARLAAKSRAA